MISTKYKCKCKYKYVKQQIQEQIKICRSRAGFKIIFDPVALVLLLAERKEVPKFPLHSTSIKVRPLWQFFFCGNFSIQLTVFNGKEDNDTDALKLVMLIG